MKRLVAILISCIAIGAGIFAFLNYQLIIDHAVVSQYKPSNAVVELENQVRFSDKGKFLFHAAQAELNDATNFNRNCEKKDAHSVVLGCYHSPQRIYVFDVKDSRLEGIRPVTAAHEMLHAAYDRMPVSERERVHELIDAALPSVMKAQNDLADRLKIYEKTEPGERYNELHSILGSEAESLPSELEEHYRQYFQDRSLLARFASSYAKVFNDLKANQDALVAELKLLNAEISSLSDEYNLEIEQLNNDIEAFNSRAQSPNGFSGEVEFAAVKSGLLARRDQIEAKRQTVSDKISSYNEKRNSLLALDVQVEELNSSIDSTKLPSL